MESGIARIGVLSAFGLLVVFYAAVGAMVLRPGTDEDFRRTYVTREFGVYPPSAFFKGANGLDYVPGTTVDLTRPVSRHYLNRFDWIWREPPGPWLDGYTGRIFLHLVDAERRPELAHRLTLTMSCTDAPDRPMRFTVAVNGTAAGTVSCPAAASPFSVTFDLPPGAFGRERYDAIVLTRAADGLADRLWTILGARLSAFSLVSFKVEPKTTP